jgi:hypothetical protein
VNQLFIGSPDKTNFLLQFIAGDLPAGLTLIDPTGHLARAVTGIIPVKYTERVVYFDPSDMNRPAGLNVLEGVPPDGRQLLTENMCAYFEAMWPNGWGAQSNYILANCIRVLLDTPGSTLLGVLKLLTDKSYRAQCISNCPDPVVLKNWQVINGWDARQSQAAIAPLLNKIGTLLMSPAIRNIVGQRHSTFSWAKKNIVIANLDRSENGDLTARLLGGLLIARSSGHVYINDFPFFASEHFASLFPQERFSVSLSFLDEVPPRLQQSLLSIEDKVALKTSPTDAERLMFYLGIMNPRRLTELGPDEARTPIGDINAEQPLFHPRLRPIQRRTWARHTRPRAIVEASINNQLALT